MLEVYICSVRVCARGLHMFCKGVCKRVTYVLLGCVLKVYICSVRACVRGLHIFCEDVC